jgi:hypothetical protein
MVEPFSQRYKVPTIIQRKLYHGLACVLLLPPILYLEAIARAGEGGGAGGGGDATADLIYLAMGVAMAILILVEFVRVARALPPPFGSALQAFMSQYVDERDRGPGELTAPIDVVDPDLHKYRLLSVTLYTCPPNHQSSPHISTSSSVARLLSGWTSTCDRPIACQESWPGPIQEAQQLRRS